MADWWFNTILRHDGAPCSGGTCCRGMGDLSVEFGVRNRCTPWLMSTGYNPAVVTARKLL